MSIAAAAALTACATGPTAYGPASGSGLGFNNQQIEKDRFHISFTGRSEEEARNLALFRAAEITLEQGYDNFRIVGGGTSGDQRRGSGISTSVGVGVGSGGYRGRGTRTNVGVGINVNDIVRAVQGKKITASMEVLLGRGGAAPDANVYDARQIVERLKPQTFTP